MYQKLVIVGRLGRDPEMRYMPDGTAVTNLNVATDRRWTDKSTGQQTGSPRVYTRQDGTAGSSFEMTAEVVRFLGGRDEGGGSGNYDSSSQGGGGKPAAQEEDDIPF